MLCTLNSFATVAIRQKAHQSTYYVRRWAWCTICFNNNTVFRILSLLTVEESSVFLQQRSDGCEDCHSAKRPSIYVLCTSLGMVHNPFTVFRILKPYFMFAAYLIWNWHLQKWGFPPGFEPRTSRTPNPSSAIARHACDAAWPAFLYPYRPTGDDVVGLRTIFFMLYSEL